MLEELKEILDSAADDLKTMTVTKIIGDSVECVGDGKTQIFKGEYSVGDEVLISGSSIFALKESETVDKWIE